MRSALIVPAGDRAAFARAATSGADAILADAAAAAPLPPGSPALYLRVPPLDNPASLAGLGAAMALRPVGILLPGSAGRADVQRLGARLAVQEALLGLGESETRILTLATETPQAIAGLSSYRGASARLVGLVWSPAPLAASLRVRRDDARPLRLARDLLLLAARAADVLALDAAFADDPDLDGLRAEAEAARDDGFDGKVVRNAAQVAVVNAVFAAS